MFKDEGGVITEDTLLSQLFEVRSLVENDPWLTEIMINPNGSLWYETKGETYRLEGVYIPVSRREAIIRLLAGYYDKMVTKREPTLNVKLPIFHGGRLQALMGHIVGGPAIVIRIPARHVLTLPALVRSKTLTLEQARHLTRCVRGKKNIIVAGGTGSGKTTIVNALLQLIKTRVYLIEDNPELRVATENVVEILLQDYYSSRTAVQDSLRMNPGRVIVGEVRKGEDAIELLKVWGTGQPGGLATIHASSAEGVADRLYNLMQEVVVTPSRDLIQEAVDVVVMVEKVLQDDGRFARRVTKILSR